MIPHHHLYVYGDKIPCAYCGNPAEHMLRHVIEKDDVIVISFCEMHWQAIHAHMNMMEQIDKEEIEEHAVKAADEYIRKLQSNQDG